ncbi:GntR family transcriptional regulator [Leucobacter sp. HY1908]
MVSVKLDGSRARISAKLWPMEPQLEIVSRKRMSDVAFERLLDAIVREDLAPGSRIRDIELAAQLGLSRTPVREAVNRLVSLGLADAKPSAHTVVSTLTTKSVARTLEVLESLDRLAVAQAVPNIGESELKHLTELNQEFTAASRAGGAQEILGADMKFHRVLRSHAQNPVLARVLSQLDPHIQRILFRKFSSRLGAPNTRHHHAALIALIAKGDAAGAAESSAHQWRELGGQIQDLFLRD